jgi:hypothetical protein
VGALTAAGASSPREDSIPPALSIIDLPTVALNGGHVGDGIPRVMDVPVIITNDIQIRNVAVAHTRRTL